jgi:SAM-dependent methyltransferase
MTNQPKQAASPKRPWQERYLDRFYRGRRGWKDGTTQFHELILKHLPKEGQILELGPGPANRTSAFLSRAGAAVDGLDVDEEARQNPALRHAYIAREGPWPVGSDRYDAVVANYVLEHLSQPAATMAEVYRVLRPGGLFFFRTPNLWHYVSVVSWLSPHWFHRRVANRLRRLPANAHEPYATYYRMNATGRARALLYRAGFTEVELLTIEKEPSYGLSSPLLFFLFLAYERLVNSSDFFAAARSNILGVFARPPRQDAPHGLQPPHVAFSSGLASRGRPP